MISADYLKSYQEYISSIDLLNLHDKITKFRMLDFKRMSYSELSKAILTVLCVNTNGAESACLLKSYSQYSKGTRFYRVRKLDVDDHFIPLREVKSPKDVWNPPASKVGLGRLNRENESLLYTSPITPVVAIQEMKVADNQNFVLSVFEAREDIKVCNMAIAELLPSFSAEENLKHKMLNDFLVHEFIRDVGLDTTYLYKISETIMKDYYDLPSDTQDGWCYPSVAKKGQFNVCFREEKARKKLKLVGIQIATKQDKDDGMMIRPKLIGLAKTYDEPFKYHEMGSAEQIKVFPEYA